MGIYTDFWKKTLKEILKNLSPTVSAKFEIDVSELTTIGERESSGFNGRLSSWAGRTEKFTNSSVFRNLKELIDDNIYQFKNVATGELELKVKDKNLNVRYEPLTFEFLIEKYKNISDERKINELYKWKLINKFQKNLLRYSNHEINFVQFYHDIDFKNLIYPTGQAVLNHVLRDESDEFEKLLFFLFDETIELQSRVSKFKNDFDKLYFSLPGHGKNTFLEERTIATFLTFRYPEKYTFFKDSFYSKLSKGLGIKPYQKGEKIFHYYTLVDRFVKNQLKNTPNLINEKNKRLDDECYRDNNNLILAQDILFLTLDSEDNIEEPEEDNLDKRDKNHALLKKENKMEYPLNKILYGPPGTGKTYNSIDRAVAIANPQFYSPKLDRDEVKKEFDRLIKEGQIEFITFHQSMSYEDFIEGIKPVEPKENDSFLKYEIKDGIFKRLAERASKVPKSTQSVFSISNEDYEKSNFYKMSLGDTSNPDDDLIYEWCLDNNYIALGWGDAIDFTGKSEIEIQKMVPTTLENFAARAVNYFIYNIKSGDFVVVTYGNLQFRAIGRVRGEYEYKNVNGLHVHQFRKVDWILKNVELPYEEIYNKQFQQQSIYRLNKQGIRKEFFVNSGHGLNVAHTPKNYVLIIDEINRGNVSNIFGELITLIEDDKRMGEAEAITVTLPYSKNSFSVPSNLYIIGTMNTADRSVEALDTALRRRFAFEEIKPDILKIDESPPEIDLQQMLSTINRRLEILLNKDHLIGHAWLMKIDTLEKLQSAFKNKIMPLFKEFFYNNYEKIGLVLGNNFVEQLKIKKSLFAKFRDSEEFSGDYEDKVIYKIRDPYELGVEDFQSIYYNNEL